jgi:predicted transcriptional regulator
MDKGQITVRELATMLGLDSATACNNRIARLYQLHLVRREATVVPEGGRQYSYSAVV